MLNGEISPFQNTAIKTKVYISQDRKNSSTSYNQNFPLVSSVRNTNPSQEQIRFNQKLIKHHTIKPPKHFFAHARNQYVIESKVNLTHKYQPISSFEQKLLKEMSRISNRYRKNESRYNYYPNKNLDIFWNSVPDFTQYKQLKQIENRFQGHQERGKLKPLIYVKKDNLNKLANRLYQVDQDSRQFKFQNMLRNSMSK